MNLLFVETFGFNLTLQLYYIIIIILKSKLETFL